MSEYNAFGLGPVRFRHNNFLSRQVFTLEFQNLVQTDIDKIRLHYNNNQGTSGVFSVPSAIFGGVTITDSSSLFRYVETPQEEHFGVYNSISITLEAVEGKEMAFGLDAGGATLPSEQTVDEFVFEGTAPFILDGSIASEATLTLDGNV